MSAVLTIQCGEQLKESNQPIMQIPPMRTTGEKWARNTEDNAIRFAEHLEKNIQPYDD